MAHHLGELLDFKNHYIEPFAGSAVLFFRNCPQKAFLNDINCHLIDLYQDIRADPYYIWKFYSSIPATPEHYKSARDRFNSIRRSKIRSSLFLFLNHYCFNGIFRTNSCGAFNTPFGGQKPVKRMTLEKIVEFGQLLSNVELHSDDFEVFLRKIRPTNASIYMDPPYFTVEDRIFREYGPGVFSRFDLERLFVLCRELSAEGNRIVVSYQDCAEFRSLFGAFIVDSIDVVRNVGGFRDRRKIQRELIAVL